jgi:catechol 2,3-dioxygenase-like lactoylglutathione lyase family enzyme
MVCSPGLNLKVNEMFWKQQKKYHVNPRFRAYGRARLEIAGRAQSQEVWDRLWKPPQNPFPFSWGEGWKHCVEYKVDDFAAEVGFYVDVLGFPVNALDPEHAMFTGPNDEFFIAIVPTLVVGQSTPPEAIRLQFMVADILATTKILETRGVTFEQQPGPCEAGSSFFTSTFRTPHGICVDLWGIVPEEEQPKANVREISPLDANLSSGEYYNPTDYEPNPGELEELDQTVAESEEIEDGETMFTQPEEDSEPDLFSRPVGRFAAREDEEATEAEDEEYFAEEQDDRFTPIGKHSGRYTFNEAEEPYVFDDDETDFIDEEEDGQLDQAFISTGRYTFDEFRSQGDDEEGETESESGGGAGLDGSREKVGPDAAAEEREQLRFFSDDDEDVMDPDFGGEEAEADHFIEPEYIPADDDASVETNITDALKEIKSRNLGSNPLTYRRPGK